MRILPLCLLLAACSGTPDPDEPGSAVPARTPGDTTAVPEADSAVTITGVVRHFDLEGGFFAIRGDDGVTYDPSNLGEAFRAPLRSDVPALFVSGTLDGRTPPANAVALLPGFSDAVHLLVRGASHDDELWLGNPKIAAHVAGFLAGRPVIDAELEVSPPAMAQGKLGLLMQVLGVGPGTVLAALGMLVALVLVVLALLRRRRHSARVRNSVSGPQ